MYKFGIILTDINDYLRRCDLVAFEIDYEKLRVEFDPQGRVYIVEGVNQANLDRLLGKLAEKDVNAASMSVAKWKVLPDV